MFTFYDNNCPKRLLHDIELLAELHIHNVPDFPMPYNEFMKYREVLILFSMTKPHLHIMFIYVSQPMFPMNVLVCNKGHTLYFSSPEDAVRSIFNLPDNFIVFV